MKRWAVSCNGRLWSRHFTELGARSEARRQNRGMRKFDLIYTVVRLP